MQFHSTRIILHQRFAFRSAKEDLSNFTLNTTMAARISEHARLVCVSSATRIAKLFETFRRSLDVRALQSTGTQYAAFGARVLIKHVTLVPLDEAVEPVAHLQSLFRTLKEMSKTFQPALKPLSDITTAFGAFEKRQKQRDVIEFSGRPNSSGHPAMYTHESRAGHSSDVSPSLSNHQSLGSQTSRHGSFPASDFDTGVTQLQRWMTEHGRARPPSNRDGSSNGDIFGANPHNGLYAKGNSPPEATRSVRSLDGWEELFGNT
jgi:hypothetical protein